MKVNAVRFPVLSTIKVGTYKSVSEIREALKRSGQQGHEAVERLLDAIPLIESESEITLHVATLNQITQKNFASGGEVYRAIRSLGYNLCPAETAVQLLLQDPYCLSSYSKWHRFAMKTLVSREICYPFIFGVDGKSGCIKIKTTRSEGCIGMNGGYSFIFASHE